MMLRYRIMDEGTKTGSDELKAVFETHLAEAGQMFFDGKQASIAMRGARILSHFLFSETFANS